MTEKNDKTRPNTNLKAGVATGTHRKRLYTRADLAFPAVVLVLTVVLMVFNPDRVSNVTGHAREFLIEMITILPAVVILMGLFSVFVPAKTVVRYLGVGVGVRGFFLALALGTLPTGPLYVAFPLVRTLRQKGAGTANLVAFITAWACIKLPQEIVELRFLGWRFTLVRLLLTIGAAAIMGFVADRVLHRWETNPEAKTIAHEL